MKARLLALAVLLLPATLQADPPDRVARLSYVSGTVSFRAADLDDWSDARPNIPVTTGDHVWVDDDSRAELHVGSTAMRLDRATACSFLNLDDQTTQMRLAEGRLNVHLRRLDDDETVEVDTP